MSKELRDAESELWQIVRMHHSDIKIRFKVSADYGVFFYWATMRVCGVRRTYVGRHLFKRYNEMVRDLKYMYGANLYKYDTKPLKKL